MSLRDRTGERADPFTRAANGEVAGLPLALVPLAHLDAALAARTPDQQIGVEIANTTRPSDLAARFDRLALIAVGFPGFGDGRGFSIGRSLRAAGFKGRLRAVGPLIADQFAYALACGFDEVELPEALAQRQPVAQWLAALAETPGGLAVGASLLDIRHAARRGRGA